MADLTTHKLIKVNFSRDQLQQLEYPKPFWNISEFTSFLNGYDEPIKWYSMVADIEAITALNPGLYICAECKMEGFPDETPYRLHFKNGKSISIDGVISYRDLSEEELQSLE